MSRLRPRRSPRSSRRNVVVSSGSNGSTNCTVWAGRCAVSRASRACPALPCDATFDLPFAQKLAAIGKSPFETFVYMRWDLQQLQDAFLDRSQWTDRAVANSFRRHDAQV